MHNFQRLKRGQPLRLNEQTVSALLHAAEHHAGHHRDPRSVGPPEYRFEGVQCQVRNDTGAVLDRWGICGLDEPLILPADNLKEFQNYPRFKAVAPTLADHDGRFAVAIEPIADGSIGLAVFSGLVPTLVRVPAGSEWLDYADVDDGEAGNLLALPSGSAQVLWREDEPDEDDLAWALVRLGAPPGDVSLWGKADSAISTTGTVSLYLDGSTDSTYDVTATKAKNQTNAIPSGNWCSVTWFRRERKWYAAGC